MLKYLFAAMILFQAGGCAMALRGSRQKVTITTEPPSATLLIDGQTLTTPAKLTLKRKEAYDVVITKDGYVPIAFCYKAVWDGATMGNVIMPGGSAGAGLDILSGADLSFNELRPIKLSPAAGPTTMPVQMKEHRGMIVMPEEYERLLQEERDDRSRFPGNEN